MSITDNFYNEMCQDLVFQEYLFQMEKRKRDEHNDLLRIESEAYDLMCEQSYLEILQMEKEYRSIQEWEQL